MEWIKFFNKCITLTIHHTKPIGIINRFRLLYITKFYYRLDRLIGRFDHKIYNAITFLFRYHNSRNFDKYALIIAYNVRGWSVLLSIINNYNHGKSILLSIHWFLHKWTLTSLSKQYEASPLEFISNIGYT